MVQQKLEPSWRRVNYLQYVLYFLYELYVQNILYELHVLHVLCELYELYVQHILIINDPVWRRLVTAESNNTS